MKFLGIIISVLLLFPATARAQDASSRFLTVVELFTSQACPRSPAGDRNLAMIADQSNVLALTFPVTYWNYLGWADTLASEVFDDRQKFYISRLQDEWLYTPQAVIQGRESVSAENLDDLKAAVSAAQGQVNRIPPPVMSDDRSTLTLLKSSLIDSANTILQVVFYERDPITVEVTSGKNAGQTLSYVNVVRSLLRADGARLDVPRELRDLSCAVLVQDTTSGSITGAALCPPLAD